MDGFYPKEEYAKALKLGRKDSARSAAEGGSPYALALEEIFPEADSAQQVDVGLIDIPMELIVGTRTAGRQFTLSPRFLPLLEPDTEFAAKWCKLAEASMSYNGISDPILCFEYYGKFYVQEGNKRVSLMRYFGSPIIPGQVIRLLPTDENDPRLPLYREFLEFFRVTRLYSVQFTHSGSYRKLLVKLEAEEPWDGDFRSRFSARYSRFVSVAEEKLDLGNLTCGDAFLVFLRYYGLQELHEMPLQQLKETVAALQSEITALSQQDPVCVQTAPADHQKESLLDKLIPRRPKQLKIAFIHEGDPETSGWTLGHEKGRAYLEEKMGEQVSTWAICNAHPGKDAEELLEQAIEDGATVIFTTTPPLAIAALRVALRHPHVKILNCSVNMPYTDIRTYYARVYEGKFITGAIAAAISPTDTIGYVGSYPIFGTPASINAFALGAKMVRPDIRIRLEWSCQRTDYFDAFRQAGIQVVSGRDVPPEFRDNPEFGSCRLTGSGKLLPVASPIWNWGVIYEQIVRSILDGSWEREQHSAGSRAVNYWWGMSSGAIDVVLDETLPQSVRTLANILRKGLQQGSFTPFDDPFHTQDGRIMAADGPLTVDEILHMDYLCDHVDGTIPRYDELLPMAQKLVRLQGIYRDAIPPEKEDNAL